MRYTDTLDVYTKLRQALGEEGAKTITIALESALEEADKDLLGKVATKQDLETLKRDSRDIKEDLVAFKVATKQDLESLKQDLEFLKQDLGDFKVATKEDITGLKNDITNLKTELRAEFREKIATLKSDLLRGIFIFWISQVGVITGIVFSAIKFVK